MGAHREQKKASAVGAGDLTPLLDVDACFDALSQAQRLNDSAGIRSACGRLLDLYEAGSDEVRFKIVAGGGPSMPAVERRRLLERVLREDRSGLVRHEAAFALSNFPDEACEALLCSVGLNDSNSLVRHEAAIALMTVGSERALQYLEHGLRDGNSEVVLSCRLAISAIHYRSNRSTSA